MKINKEQQAICSEFTVAFSHLCIPEASRVVALLRPFILLPGLTFGPQSAEADSPGKEEVFLALSL